MLTSMSKISVLCSFLCLRCVTMIALRLPLTTSFKCNFTPFCVLWLVDCIRNGIIQFRGEYLKKKLWKKETDEKCEKNRQEKGDLDVLNVLVMHSAHNKQ